MDPAYLSQTTDSTQASNGMTGSQPLMTYINNYPASGYQTFATQKVSFKDVPVNRMDNFSVRGDVTEDSHIFMGFIVQGTEPKEFAFRGLGPSLPYSSGDDYWPMSSPAVNLYQNGNLIASNVGWTSLPDGKQQLFRSTGLAILSPLS